MKTTEQFRKTIEAFIESEKKADVLFAECVDGQPEKTIEGCVNFILKEVKNSGIAGWTDDEIFGMAKHFFDERDLKDPGAMKGIRAVVNHHVELSDEEKKTAKENALKSYEAAERKKLEEKAKKERERAIKKEQAKKQALIEKRERESKMQLDLFGM